MSAAQCGGQEWKPSDQFGGFLIIQVEEDDGLDQSGSCEVEKKWSDSDYVLRVETIGFGLDAGPERKREAKDN